MAIYKASAKKKKSKKPAPKPVGKTPKGYKMIERKSKSAPPPKELRPFPDFIGPTPGPSNVPKPYMGTPQGTEATDTPHGVDGRVPTFNPPPEQEKWTSRISKRIKKRNSNRV